MKLLILFLSLLSFDTASACESRDGGTGVHCTRIADGTQVSPTSVSDRQQVVTIESPDGLIDDSIVVRSQRWDCKQLAQGYLEVGYPEGPTLDRLTVIAFNLYMGGQFWTNTWMDSDFSTLREFLDEYLVRRGMSPTTDEEWTDYRQDGSAIDVLDDWIRNHIDPELNCADLDRNHPSGP